MIVAAGVVTNDLFSGVTIKELGAAPNEHCIMAPATTCLGILAFYVIEPQFEK